MRDLKLGVVNYYALASGFLSGKYRSEADLKKSVRGDRVAGYLNERGLRILAALDAVAAKHGTQPAAIALAWQIARPTITAPIASATSLAQLASLGEAIRVQLDQDDIRRIGSQRGLKSAVAGLSDRIAQSARFRDRPVSCARACHGIRGAGHS